MLLVMNVSIFTTSINVYHVIFVFSSDIYHLKCEMLQYKLPYNRVLVVITICQHYFYGSISNIRGSVLGVQLPYD